MNSGPSSGQLWALPASLSLSPLAPEDTLRADRATAAMTTDLAGLAIGPPPPAQDTAAHSLEGFLSAGALPSSSTAGPSARSHAYP